YKSNLSLQYEVSSAISDIRYERRQNASESRPTPVRIPLRLLPRGSSVAVSNPPPKVANTLSTEEIRKLFAQEHRINTKPSTLIERCLRTLAQHLDRYPITDEVLDAMHYLHPENLHRLSILSTWYGTSTPETTIFFCTPWSESLCLGQLNVDAIVDYVAPRVYGNEDTADSWEEITDITSEWSGCPLLGHLELYQCHQISIAFLSECSSLTSLSLFGCSDFDAVDANLLQHLPPPLKSLSLIACTWLTNGMLLTLLRHQVKNSGRLRHLRVWACCRVALDVVHEWEVELPRVQFDIRQLPDL
ncbi:unnamed protein product, partial [Aphanomyces euteiches]